MAITQQNNNRTRLPIKMVPTLLAGSMSVVSLFEEGCRRFSKENHYFTLNNQRGTGSSKEIHTFINKIQNIRDDIIVWS
jgi:hypothetical protein